MKTECDQDGDSKDAGLSQEKRKRGKRGSGASWKGKCLTCGNGKSPI